LASHARGCTLAWQTEHGLAGDMDASQQEPRRRVGQLGPR
jgi:hypothetical protein